MYGSKYTYFKLNCFHTLLDFPSIHLCADGDFQAEKIPFLWNLRGGGGERFTAKRGHNNIMKFMSNAAAQRRSICDTSPDLSARNHPFSQPWAGR